VGAAGVEASAVGGVAVEAGVLEQVGAAEVEIAEQDDVAVAEAGVEDLVEADAAGDA
jgi:hypothetical protein